ncbi:hypothetical protein H6S82_13390 [Planktothrix sp. FACHB-1355]|uniref:Uncharacterized protein n=1 Tax=Aerosakkonema funiforme FACHB-1375 TaxID=2949571 RepID=A0A926V9P5_9CYAN|nr:MULTISPECIES: hypothetical protein [Oscillatoriales]MBD2179680.1 hypothetical protein [Aerosakkonema funiforme FACHB-1375]MBD3559847.1 hypothetical protein [Planktothrix sp. FACHB-1355]
MIDKIKRVLLIALVIAGTSIGISSEAQAQRFPRRDNGQVEQILSRIESNTDRFQDSLDDALDRSRLNGTNQEDEINRYVKDFERATDRLLDRYDRGQNVTSDLRSVLSSASRIDNFLQRRRLGPRVERDWSTVRRSVNDLEGIISRARRY